MRIHWGWVATAVVWGLDIGIYLALTVILCASEPVYIWAWAAPMCAYVVVLSVRMAGVAISKIVITD